MCQSLLCMQTCIIPYFKGETEETLFFFLVLPVSASEELLDWGNYEPLHTQQWCVLRWAPQKHESLYLDWVQKACHFSELVLSWGNCIWHSDLQPYGIVKNCHCNSADCNNCIGSFCRTEQVHQLASLRKCSLPAARYILQDSFPAIMGDLLAGPPVPYYNLKGQWDWWLKEASQSHADTGITSSKKKKMEVASPCKCDTLGVTQNFMGDGIK